MRLNDEGREARMRAIAASHGFTCDRVGARYHFGRGATEVVYDRHGGRCRVGLRWNGFEVEGPDCVSGVFLFGSDPFVAVDTLLAWVREDYVRRRVHDHLLIEIEDARERVLVAEERFARFLRLVRDANETPATTPPTEGGP